MAFNPKFEITSYLLELITEAVELKVWIAQALVDVTWLPTLQNETTVRLAHSSTAIEGNPLSLPEVEALARGDNIIVPDKARQEVLNCLAAMRWIWKRNIGAAIKESDLLRLHKLLTQKILAAEQVGHYKTRPNRIVNSQGHTIYSPPPPQQAQSLTLEFLDWLNSSAISKLDPIIVSAISHHRLVSIHPFSDGNGRMARALGIWLLYSRGFDTQHLFALDEYFEQDRQLYYDKIQQARDLDDDLTYWLEYVAKGVLTTLCSTKQRILSLLIAPGSSKIILSKRQEDFLRFLRDRGRVKTPELEKAFKLTRARIGQIIKPLVEAGLVISEGKTRATTYRIARIKFGQPEL